MKRAGRILTAAVLVPLLGLLPGKAEALELEVAGKSAVLMDVATGTVLYESNPHEALAPASVTKVMTMLLIMEAIDSGKIGWDDMVTASEAAAAKGGSQIYLKVGETMSVSDMLKSIAVSSANDCACAMAEHIAGSEAAFVERMNARARELGMNDTNFVNCTGLDDDDSAKAHRTSAYDIALMSRELLKNHPMIKKYTTIWMDTVRGGAFGLSNTNKLIRFYQGATGLKTGFTTGAGYCLSASALRDGMELIAVVMGAQTSQARNAACKSLLDYGFANFAVISPELTETEPVPVRLGRQDSVDVKLGDSASLLIDKSQKSAVTMDVQLEPEVTAPVSQGQRLGTLTVKSGEQVLSQVPLVAAEPVDRLTWGSLFLRVLGRAAMAKK
ncbi:MAG: D-alanyl-D-alanine carboxypeptidase family protein [Candidatus Faecousia sp.]|nr:D-alanyl-D-alanine carboxypeptidase family protein [Candidatus Faecousia sp.]